MSLSSIRIDAEKKAGELMARLRDGIVSDVTQARILSGGAGVSLRAKVGRDIEQAIPDFSKDFSPMLVDAYIAGINRANTETLGVKRPPINVPVDVFEFRDLLERKLWRIEAEVQEDVNTLLLRGALSDADSAEIARRIGDRQGGGFATADRRLSALVSQLLSDVEDTAHYKQMRHVIELAKSEPDMFKKKDAKRLGSGKPETDKIPLVMTVWAHSHGGNPPRANHVAMHGKGVVMGEAFTLLGADGIDYFPRFPKDTILPVGERISCHCTGVTKVVLVTKEEAAKITERSRESGGYRDSRWAVK